MQANVGREPAHEVVLRRQLHRLGARYRKQFKPEADLKCTADLAFMRKRLCVFIDGCYWHGCPEHYRNPKTNSEWWKEKIQANADRDKRFTQELVSRGWRVIRIWEHELVGAGVLRVAKRIIRALQVTYSGSPDSCCTEAVSDGRG